MQCQQHAMSINSFPDKHCSSFFVFSVLVCVKVVSHSYRINFVLNIQLTPCCHVATSMREKSYSCIFVPVQYKQRTILIYFIGTQKYFPFKKEIMATRTSTRATKAVKFVDSAESDEGEDFVKASSTQMKIEEKKSRGRPPNSRRNRNDDDEEWEATNEHVENEEDEEDDDEDDGEQNNGIGRDVTKKFLANRSTDSVYDFG